MRASPPSVSYATTIQANQSGSPRDAKYFPAPAIPNTMALRYRPCRMNRTPMLTRSSNAPYGALSASIIFPPFLLRIENQLGAAEQRELAPLFAVGQGCVPHLRGAPQVHGAGFAVEHALLRRTEEIRFELHRGEVLGVRGQVRNASVARERIGEGDDRPSVQIAVRREERLAQLDLPFYHALGDLREDDPDEAGQVVFAEILEAIDVESGAKRHGLSSRVRISRPRAAARFPRSRCCDVVCIRAGSSSRSRRAGASRPRRARPLWDRLPPWRCRRRWRIARRETPRSPLP